MEEKGEMTIKELSKYNDLKNEIKQLEDNIKEIEATVIGSSKITDKPIVSTNNNDNPTERIAIKLLRLRKKLSHKKEKLIAYFNEIEDSLDTIEDGQIRIIIRKRFLEGKTWSVISKELVTDRSTPYYRLQKYLKARSLDAKKEI